MNSKAKGNSFERKIANLLSTTFEHHTNIKQSFLRNSDSGSYSGGFNQKRIQTHNLEKASFGDIICPSNFRFTIECKSYKTPPTFTSILKQENALLDEWIEQGETDAKNANKQMMIISKFNNVPESVIVRNHTTKIFPIIVFKEHWIISLNTFLQQEIDYFFDVPSPE